MVMLEGENALGLERAFPRSESGAKPVVVKPTLYSEQEIARMMLTTPPGLEKVENIETPVGTWSIEGSITVFDAKPPAEIAKITKVNLRRKLTRLASIIFQMS